MTAAIQAWPNRPTGPSMDTYNQSVNPFVTGVGPAVSWARRRRGGETYIGATSRPLTSFSGQYSDPHTDSQSKVTGITGRTPVHRGRDQAGSTTQIRLFEGPTISQLNISKDQLRRKNRTGKVKIKKAEQEKRLYGKKMSMGLDIAKHSPSVIPPGRGRRQGRFTWRRALRFSARDYGVTYYRGEEYKS